MSIRRTNGSARNAAVSALLDPALSAARDALQRFLEKTLKTQFGAGWQATLERDRVAGQGRPQSDRWDWGTISYRLGHFRAAQAEAVNGVVTEPLIALARLAKAYRNLFQHEELSDAQVRHALEGLALLHEAMGSKVLAAETRAALEGWAGPARGAKRPARKAPSRAAAKRAAPRPRVKPATRKAPRARSA
ncbi:MAG: hypothetical protein L0Y66_15330 [Myxococcaceae bacterium]|nr:hypothetical protein [Myxococcaceae bacterium]MCI0670184.1 hypothetical protein [Myxococcaceae bacterium]